MNTDASPRAGTHEVAMQPTQRHGRRSQLRAIRTALILATAIGGTSCILYRGDRRPNLVATGARPVLESAPRIEVVLRHRHTMDGQDAGSFATATSLKTIEKSFERVRQETPFLANAKSGASEPEYLLDLDTEVAEHGKVGAFISGLTMGVIPGFIASDVIVRASLCEPSGKPLAHSESSGQLKGIFDIIFLPALPIVAFTAPGDELVDDTFRDAMIQVALDLEKQLASKRK